MIEIQYGDPVEVRDASGVWLPAVARGSVEPTHVNGRRVHDFPVIQVAIAGRAEPMPWPAADVRPYPAEQAK